MHKTNMARSFGAFYAGHRSPRNENAEFRQQFSFGDKEDGSLKTVLTELLDI